MKSYLEQDNVAHNPHQHYLDLIRLQLKIYFGTSFTISKWKIEKVLFSSLFHRTMSYPVLLNFLRFNNEIFSNYSIFSRAIEYSLFFFYVIYIYKKSVSLHFTQQYLVWNRLQRKISFVKSFTISKWLSEKVLFSSFFHRTKCYILFCLIFSDLIMKYFPIILFLAELLNTLCSFSMLSIFIKSSLFFNCNVDLISLIFTGYYKSLFLIIFWENIYLIFFS